MRDPIIWQWGILIVFGLIFFFIAPYARSVAGFFAASSTKGKRPGAFLLTTSLVISWIFAKSITNAANLGLEFGMVGGIAYAVYYLSFVIGGLIIYQLRTKGGFSSIHHFLESKFGQGAVILFSLLIGIRLFNEVWSNTMVIGSYFGDAGSSSYYMAIIVFTVLTLAYTMKGGLRSSLLTDAIQMVLFGVLLFILLSLIIPSRDEGIIEYVQSGSWTMATGLNLMFAAFIQIFSYPFHDPVLTDRGFISEPRTTLRSFLLASVIGFACIVIFSMVGIYGSFAGLEGQATVQVSKLLGVAAMLGMNFIMVTSAASTLDSALSSFAKLTVIDLGMTKTRSVKGGRFVMVILAVAGTLPIFANPEILSATTVSGTMVIGLAPIFIFWNLKVPKLSFHLPVVAGVVMGLILAFGYFPEALIFTSGRYADLLWVNIWGTLLVILLFFIPIMFQREVE